MLRTYTMVSLSCYSFWDAETQTPMSYRLNIFQHWSNPAGTEPPFYWNLKTYNQKDIPGNPEPDPTDIWNLNGKLWGFNTEDPWYDPKYDCRYIDISTYNTKNSYIFIGDFFIFVFYTVQFYLSFPLPLSTYQSIYLSLYLFMDENLYGYLSNYIAICLPVCLSVGQFCCLSISVYF